MRYQEHGRRHVAAAGESTLEALLTLWVIHRRDAVEALFGFKPRSDEALQFWKEHGGTP